MSPATNANADDVVVEVVSNSTPHSANLPAIRSDVRFSYLGVGMDVVANGHQILDERRRDVDDLHGRGSFHTMNWDSALMRAATHVGQEAASFWGDPCSRLRCKADTTIKATSLGSSQLPTE